MRAQRTASLDHAGLKQVGGSLADVVFGADLFRTSRFLSMT